jgi:hypothetical protein
MLKDIFFSPKGQCLFVSLGMVDLQTVNKEWKFSNIKLMLNSNHTK